MSEVKEEIQLRVALYLRVSTKEQEEKFGLPAQRSAIEGIIQSRGKLKDGRDAMVLAGKNYEYVDDISGSSEIDERPEFARLKEDILRAPEGHKPFDIVAVYKIDRFARKLRILMDVLKFFEEYQVEFVSATESIDTSSPFGRAMLGIMGVIAELELETIRERTQRGREQANLAGVFMGSHPPFGYKKDKEGHLVIFEKEVEVVREIYSLFTINKSSPQKIADILTGKEALTPDASAVKHGKRKGTSHKTNPSYFWRAERVREILSNDIYTGVRYYNKTKGGKLLPKSEWKESAYRHEAIIYSHIFELAQQQLANLSDRKTLTKRQDEGNIYLLSALLKCDHCRKLNTPVESEMMSWTGSRKEINKQTQKYSYYYQCNRKNRKKFSIVCPVVPVPAEPLEEYVIEFVKQLLANPQAVFEYQKQLASSKLNTQRWEADKEHYEGLLNALPLRKERLRHQHIDGEIDTPTFKKEWAVLEQSDVKYKSKINEADFQLSQVTLSKGYEASLQLYADKYGKALEQITKDRKQLYDLIHSLVYQIVVYARPKGQRDVIAGRRKEDQMIPNQVDIYLNLPQNLLRELYTHKFGVRTDNL